MDAMQKLIQAVATLLWPVILIVLIYQFRPAITAIIESAKSRKFTLKVGGQELTMEEANKAQQSLIADLQRQVSELQKHSVISHVTVEAAAATLEAPRSISAVLWVDDNPKNNSYFVQQLTDLKITVDLAESTAEGYSLFTSHKYDYIISDMGRHEGPNYRSTAGMDLLKKVRERDSVVPFVLFCSNRSVKLYSEEAKRLGANAITSSPTELFGVMNLANALVSF